MSLEEKLQHPDGHCRWDAALKLGERGDPSAIKALLPLLGDTVFLARQGAARALNQLGWVPTTDQERAAHLVALGQWDAVVELGGVAAEPLVRILGDERDEVSRHAREALMQIGPPAVPRLVQAMDDDDARLGAATVLGNIADQAAVPALIEALGDSGTMVRGAAAASLGSIADNRAILPLIAALKEKHRHVWLAVSGALVSIGEPARLALEGALNDGRAVGPALARFGESARPALKAATKHDDDAVQERATQALALLDQGSGLWID